MIPHNTVVPTPEEMCKKIMFDQKNIKYRLWEIANNIYDFYQEQEIYHLHSITVLMGATRIANCILNYIAKINTKNPKKPPLVVHEDSVMISSYKNEFTTNYDPKIITQTQFSTKKHHVLIIEDIIDSGLTMKYLIHDLIFETKKPESIKILTLIDKPINRTDLTKDIKADFSGFTINKNLFLVGYGLDYKHYYRNLPYIMAIKDECKK